MWAAAPVDDNLWVSFDRIKPSRSMAAAEACFGGGLHVRYISTVICDVQERLPEMPAWRFAVFAAGAVVGHKLESLILAQNERWRHA